ncbi:hypothetical protein SSS_07652 [Sarcoptes scabiei]|uniref:Spaetzle domain-containing protein n=1 Tax=Sarcoptes scabiei TaxID=52283 RepID=A0A834R273_SARSC|nr:hypothetical protein SSS_07652 [Sarcoptes scabiei]
MYLSLGLSKLLLTATLLQTIFKLTLGSDDSLLSHRCFKRNKQIICPTDKSDLINLRRADGLNSSIEFGPTMYHRKFTIFNEETSSNLKPAMIGKNFRTFVISYTKQYDDDSNTEHNHLHLRQRLREQQRSDENQKQNAFDLSDEEEHRFMHSDEIEENIIDDGHQPRKISKSRINNFIDENKAMIRRMFGDYDQRNNKRDGLSSMDFYETNLRDHFSSFHYDGQHRRVRRSITPKPSSSNKIDSCESASEIVTPYWASNSAGKIRAIVNTQHLQQAIQQEVCQAVQTRRCNKDCRCEQKYKWHRLLAYDPDDDCKGIFMDWFLFPSCCVCRCKLF